MEPQAKTSTMLNPTGSLDLRRLTYSLARESPASKWVIPFCSGTCLATFSLWKLKNTNLPKNSDRPVLRLMTRDVFNSALMAPLDRFLGVNLTVDMDLVRESGDLVVGLRPWKVGGENRVEEAMVRERERERGYVWG
ncbi:unnamed protein product [Camellia sinensis]